MQQIIKFKTMDEAIARANKTQYGLGAAIFTKDIDKAMMFVQGVRAGTVWYDISTTSRLLLKQLSLTLCLGSSFD